jgi:sugar (pentulose or hexulose) kinase
VEHTGIAVRAALEASDADAAAVQAVGLTGQMRRHEPEIWAALAHVLLPKDFVRLRLTGEHAVDRADGSGTMLFDLAARDWSPEILEALGVEPGWLPRTFEGPTVTGRSRRPRPRRPDCVRGPR